MHLNINSDSYVLYDGESPGEIHQKHDENQGSWSLNIFDTGRHKQLKINPFKNMCIGVYIDSVKESAYIIVLSETREHLILRLSLSLCIIIIGNTGSLFITRC
jgi:hypothetical protein